MSGSSKFTPDAERDSETAWRPPCIGEPCDEFVYCKLHRAAPKLLKALENLLDQLEGIGIAEPSSDSGQWHGCEGLSFAQARRAIADVKGEE